MTTTDDWEDVSVPSGTFVKWDEPGDSVTGWVVHYDPTAGGTTFDGDVCGVLVLDDIETREMRTVTLDKGALKDAVAAASPVAGLLLRVTFDRMVPKKSGSGEYKGFKVQVNRAVKAPARPVDPASEPF